MSDTYTLSYKNFRSLEDVTLEVAPLTVIYGPNGSGKSSLIYGLLTLRNFLTNPNQNIPSLFSYPSISLGGINEVVHRHSNDKAISLSIGVFNTSELSSKFTLTLHESGGAVDLSFSEGQPCEKDLRIWGWPPFSQYGNSRSHTSQTNRLRNVFRSPYSPPSDDGVWQPRRYTSQRNDILERVNHSWRRALIRMHPYIHDQMTISQLNGQGKPCHSELARQTGFVPLRRGFSRPSYGVSIVTTAQASEDEVASLFGFRSIRAVRNQ